ncbi:MAG: cytidylate kinase family protein [Verrucomicrobia bacterium]|nr:cytidylate kinase family protein [Verrucomicrobiota bacterium]
MSQPLSFERCRAFIDCQLQSGERGRQTVPMADPRPAITISREAGAGGIPVAERLADYLQARMPTAGRPWTAFDRNLVEKVLEDHHLPAHLASHLPEDDVSQIADILEELFGLHPPSWTFVHQTAETILRLARLGNVILVGRGANVITAKLDNTFHVRLVGSLEPRLELLQDYYRLDRHAAIRFIEQHDRGRARYLRKYFHRDINDPLLYHLILNTDRFSCEEAARLIGETVMRKFYPATVAQAA